MSLPLVKWEDPEVLFVIFECSKDRGEKASHVRENERISDTTAFDTCHHLWVLRLDGQYQLVEAHEAITVRS